MASKPQQDLQKVHRRRKNRESFLETLESIVVAFVLAFVFRAFVVEAFVIPTGSMGPTLYGQHYEFQCECGYEFAVGADGRSATAPRCPNCGLRQSSPPSTVYSGDRILVLKFLYDFTEPRRWDVIVFRNPNEPEENYIKRLVGLPGEAIELVGGNVTIDGQIVHKADQAQDALWMIVHDTRLEPTTPEWRPRWVADRPWQREDHGFVLARAPPSGKTAWLVYHHRNTGGRPGNIRDFYAYNSGADRPTADKNVVTDLRLKTEVTAETAEAVLTVEMRAFKDRFRFVLPAEGSARPTRILLNGRRIAEAPGGVLPVGRAAEVEVANVDHALVLRVDGKRVTTTHENPVTPQGDVTYEPTAVSKQDLAAYHHPKAPGQPPPMAYELRVGAAGAPLSVEYLRIDRDVYYINEWMNPHGERPGHGVEGNPFSLREDEFFVCGDNSPKSFDCRLWGGPTGQTPNAGLPRFEGRPVVPRRNLVGKAFFVYWPAAGTRYNIPLAPDPSGWRLVH